MRDQVKAISKCCFSISILCFLDLTSSPDIRKEVLSQQHHTQAIFATVFRFFFTSLILSLSLPLFFTHFHFHSLFYSLFLFHLFFFHLCFFLSANFGEDLLALLSFISIHFCFSFEIPLALSRTSIQCLPPQGLGALLIMLIGKNNLLFLFRNRNQSII